MRHVCGMATTQGGWAQVRRQRGANDFRETFLEATESSPHCSWEDGTC